MKNNTTTASDVAGADSMPRTSPNNRADSPGTIDAKIASVKDLYRQLTGSEPRLGHQPYAPIPPETDGQAYVEEGLRRLQGTLADLGIQPLGTAPMMHEPTVVPRLNVFESLDEWSCELELPGVESSDLSVEVGHGILKIGALRRTRAGEGTQPTYVEAGPARFERLVPLPTPIKTDACRARLDRGLLTVTLMKERADSTRNVAVETA